MRTNENKSGTMRRLRGEGSEAKEEEARRLRGEGEGEEIVR